MIIKENIKLSGFTTLKVGGTAKYFVDVNTKEDLRDAVSFAKKNSLPIFVIGEGSDILISDNNFEAVVVRLLNKNMEINDDVVVSGAGVTWDKLVEFCVNKNLAGVECLSGIPGTVGAAPVQNIGAYGQELKDTFEKAEVYDTEKEDFVYLNNEDCKFAYRESVFKDRKFKSRYIIFEVYLKLTKELRIDINYDSLKKYLEEKNIKEFSLKNIRSAVLAIRKEKLEDPKDIPNAGSFFKNPIISKVKLREISEHYSDIPNFPNGDKVKIFAGWLIEKAGLKGKRNGDVGVSNRNALVIVNYGEGKAADIEKLAEEVTRVVSKKFGIELEREVQYVNF